MNKSLFERFIAKYNLAGEAESVSLISDGKSLKTSFITVDRSAAGTISTNNIKIDAGEYLVYDTSQLKSLLNVLDSEITCEVVTHNNIPLNLQFSDSSGTQVTYVLAADKNVIPRSPTIKNIPPFEISIDLTAKFVVAFSKAAQALSDSTTFSIVSKNNKVSVVVGYDKNNTNRVSIDTNAVSPNFTGALHFHSGYFRSILAANKEMKSGALKVSSQKFAEVSFDIDDFSVKYQLIGVDQ